MPGKETRVSYTDIHCHILHGLDDGAKDMDDALNLARTAHRCGAARIVATPHFLPGVFEPSPDEIRDKVRELNTALGNEGLQLEILPGCEVYLSERLSADYKEGRILAIGEGSHVLVEPPAMMLPQGFDEELFRLRALGPGVILAHPERNMEFRRKPEKVRRLVENGILLQVNAGSFLGVYGREAASFAGSLLTRGLVHFIGSDAHTGSSEELQSGGPDIRPALRRAFPRYSAIRRFLRQAEYRFDKIAARSDGLDR